MPAQVRALQTGLVDLQEPMTPGRVTGAQIAELWRDTQALFPASRERIFYCRDIAQGKHLVPLPTDWNDEARDEHIVQLPQRKQLQLRQTAVLAKKRPVCKREPIGLSQRAQREADELEAWLNEAMLKLFPWRNAAGKATQEAEYGLVVYPAPADWRIVPTYLDSLPDGDSGRPRREWWRDGEGRAADEDGYAGGADGYDRAKTRAAFDEEYDDFLARRLPVRIRVVSATDCLPILGDNLETEGLLVRTLYTRQQLVRRKFIWSDQKGFLQRQEASAQFGRGNQLWLYEAWLTDDDGTPYVAYSVGGLDTQYDGTEGRQAAVIDLRREWGISELPVRYCWGMHSEDDNPDLRGVPFLDPIARTLLNVEALFTNMLVHTRKSSFLGFAEEPNPNSSEDVTLEGDSLKAVQLPSSGGIVQVRGKLTPLQPAPIGPDAFRLAQMMLGEMSDASPAESVYGGEGAASGRQLVVSRDYLETANGDILLGLLEAYEWAAGMLLHVLAAMMRIKKAEIPLYQNVELPPTGEQGESRTQRAIRKLKERWIGRVYDVTAEYPKEGANLAEIEQTANLADRGFATFREVREIQGDMSPATTRAEIIADRLILTPEGLAEVQALAQQLRGIEEQQAFDELAGQGRVGPDGTPVAALRGPGDTSPDLSSPNYAASSLGGTIAGEMETGPLMQEARLQAAQPGGV